MIVYIYTFPNGKKYIGQTVQTVEKRSKNGEGYKESPKVYQAIKKYGWENVKVKTIECKNQEEMDILEKKLIKQLKTQNIEFGYNIPVRTNYLLSKHTTSCGCNRNTVNGGPSKGEELIKTILLKEQIPFQREYICKDLRNNLYRFDFYLPQSSIAIEYNGVQHYEYTSFFYKTRADFLKAQERDRIKIAYSLANNISLYVIPFWEFNNLKTSIDIFNEKFLPNDKFFNDTLWREHQKNRRT